MDLSVPAIEKLLDYAVEFIVEPVFGDWKQRRANQTAETRALGEARVRQILAIGEARAELDARQVLQQAEADARAVPSISDNEIDERIQRNLEKRVGNIKAIVDKASLALPVGDVPDVEPDVGWTSSFANAAQGVSSEEMQELWARVLAGEVARQGSTSARTLNVLRELDQSTAQLFKRLCSMAVSLPLLPEGHYLDHRVASLGGDAAQNSLRDFGIGYDKLNVLNEHGLITSDYNSWFDYRICIGLPGNLMPGRPLPPAFRVQAQRWVLIADAERDLTQEFRVSGVAFTRAGRELSKAVELEPVPKYVEALKGYFAENGLNMVQV